MTKKSTALAVVEEEEAVLPPIAPDNWLNGTPLFILPNNTDSDQLIQQVQEAGVVLLDGEGNEHVFVPPVFYILGEVATVKEYKQQGKLPATKHTTYAPRLFKVVHNVAGRAVSAVQDGTVMLGDVKEWAYFHLPSIPWQLIQDVDDFFREIDRVHHTEAIVIFTYDTSYQDTDNPSDGWGVVVPKQENTAASCDYDPTSVVDDMPDVEPGEEPTVFQVGTAHSHPGMAAYCSGTDKADQANFDGIHITYGWKYGKKETEFHIELQMGGKAWTMEPKQVFTEVPKPIENDRITPWKERVSKAKPVTTTSYSYSGYPSYTSGDTWKNLPFATKWAKLPKNCPTPEQVTLIVEPLLTTEELKDCPVCDAEFTKFMKERGKCNRCQTYVVATDDSLEKILQRREELNIIPQDLIIANDPWKSIVVWEETADDKGRPYDKVYLLHEGRQEREKKEKSSGKADGESVESDVLAGHNTLCERCFEEGDADAWECAKCGSRELLIQAPRNFFAGEDGEEDEDVYPLASYQDGSYTQEYLDAMEEAFGPFI